MKQTSFVYKIVILSLVVALYFLLVFLRGNTVQQRNISINGLYQSKKFPDTSHYNAQFFGDHYYIEYCQEGTVSRILEGTWQYIEDSRNCYLLCNSQEVADIVVLDSQGFYYYDPCYCNLVYFRRIVALASPF